MSDAVSAEPPRRKIKLETRHGSSRESRSRKDRPCDVCRSRKSACVITIKPPCRFCEIRSIDCTFNSNPRPRRRTDAIAADNAATQESKPGPTEQKAKVISDVESPQASRFPVSQVPPRRGSDISSLSTPSVTPSSPVTTGRRYLSLQQLTSPTQDPSPSYTPTPSVQIYTHNQTSIDVERFLKDRAKHSLEYGKNLTAHFVGLAGEQDTNLFSTIRYNVLNETKFIDFNIRQMYVGDAAQGTPPVHFSSINDTFSERDQSVKKYASDTIEAIVGESGDDLIRLYFRFVHPVLPVLSKSGFLMSYVTDKAAVPASLRGAIYGLACAFCSQDPSFAGRPPISQSDLFDHTHAALRRELDSPKLATLQACLLVLHEQPEASGTTESPRIWVLACQATACAQALGLHQDPTAWKLPSWEKKLRKRLWWATYAGDIWTAICHGQTPHITNGSFNTLFLDIDDLMSDEDVCGLPGELILAEQNRVFNRGHAIRYIESIRLTKVLDDVLGSCFTLQNYRLTIQQSDVAIREAEVWKCKIKAEQMLSALPPYLGVEHNSYCSTPNTNIFLHLGFFAVKFLIYRALMAPATSESKANPSSRLRYHFPTAMSEAESFMRMMELVKSMDLRVFWFRHSRTNLIHAGNFLIYLFFCASTEPQVGHAYALLERYRDILRVMISGSDWSTVGLLRPTLLRTESFFANAAGAIEQRQKLGECPVGI